MNDTTEHAPVLASNPLDGRTPTYHELVDVTFAAASAVRQALEFATKAGEESTTWKMRALEAEEKLRALQPPAHESWNCKTGGANYCPTCKAEVRRRYPRVPIIPERDVGPAPKDLPWHLADRAWMTYAGLYGSGQTMERLVERGGWHWSDFPCYLAGHRAGDCARAGATIAACRAAALQAVERDQLAAERRRIAGLIQDEASAPRLMASREVLLALREQVLALEDEP